MAKAPETEPRKKSGGLKNLAIWGMLIMLIAGLGGFGITNFGGSTTKIGSVGGRAISTDDYARALRAEVDDMSRQFGQALTVEQATALGLDRRALGSLINETALSGEADRIGISVGDARVATELATIPGFQDATGKFDRATYVDALKRNRMNTSDFEQRLRESLGRGLLQGAVTGGFVAPAAMVDTIHAYVAERRGFSMLRLTEADLATLPVAPADDVLKTYYTDNIARFTKPEAQRITYAALLPETVAATLPVDEAALKKLYEDRKADFVFPEKRIVEQLVYPDDAAAKAAKARLDAGESFETLVADRGLTLEAIDLGDVSEADLGAAGAGVFALTEPGIVGPLQSPIGPALYRMNAILPAGNTSFEDARATLTTDLQLDTARRTIGDRVEELDDLLAAGGTLEDLAAEKGLTLATIDYVPGGQNADKIASYAAFQQAAPGLEDGVTTDMVVLDDGGLAAMRLDEIVPPTPIPFETARADVITAWIADATAKALTARATEIKSGIEGGATLDSFGPVSVTPNIARDGTVPGAPPTLLQEVFKMAAGDVRVIEAPGFVSVVKLDSVMPAPKDDAAAIAVKAAIAAQVQQAMASDAFTAYSTAVSNAAGIKLDQNAINAVNTQLQ